MYYHIVLELCIYIYIYIIYFYFKDLKKEKIIIKLKEIKGKRNNIFNGYYKLSSFIIFLKHIKSIFITKFLLKIKNRKNNKKIKRNLKVKGKTQNIRKMILI